MLELLDKLYYMMPQTNIVWRSVRYGIRVLINLYARYFMIIHSKRKDVAEDTIIVSLTSFPERIHQLWITIATLLNQEYENLHVILWVSQEQFSSIDTLPRRLLALQYKGLEICFVPNDLRPHKKYFYVMQQFPNNNVVTVDDDIIYHPHLIGALVKAHKQYPDCVICNRGINICRGSYTTWKYADIRQAGIPTNEIMPTGIGGVLYPSGCYNKKYIFDVGVIKQTCLNGDDLWLNFVTRSIGTKVVLTGFRTGLVTLLSSQSSALCKSNVEGCRNDKQIAAIDNWAKKTLGIRFYVNASVIDKTLKE